MIKRGGVQMKCWDIGGQAQYRAEWGRYTRGCDVIVYVVDAHAEEKVPYNGDILVHSSARSAHLIISICCVVCLVYQFQQFL